VRDLSVNKDIENLGIVVLCKAMNSPNNLLNLNLKSFLLECCSTNAIPVDYNLFWQLSFVFLGVLLERLNDIDNHDLSSGLSNEVFFLVLGFPLFLVFFSFWEIMLLDCCEVLGKERSI